MGPSSANRIHNIHLMAEYIDGTLIRPGETFSFNGSVGPRTVERGFREGQMIIGSLLVPSIGGGVCQTATTLFNNAFELGLPILARQNHSFYISHYPMGRDAAVSWGGPDFAFRNDLKTGILITTSYTNETLTFSFWGTDPQRRIVSATGPQLNWRTPQTTYALDPYAPSGSVRTVSGSNQSGFDVTVSRQDLRARQAAPQRLVHERLRRRRPDADLRPGPLDPGPVLRPAAHLDSRGAQGGLRHQPRGASVESSAEGSGRGGWIHKLGALGSLIFGVGLLAGFFVSGDSGETAEDLIAYADDKGGALWLMQIVALLAPLLVAPLVASLWVRSRGASEALRALILVGGTLFVAFLSTALTIWAAPLLENADLNVAGAEAYLLIDDVGWVLLGLSGISIGAMIVAASLAALEQGWAPKWAVWVSIALGVLSSRRSRSSVSSPGRSG